MLIVCSSCARHVRVDTSCPFCGARAAEHSTVTFAPKVARAVLLVGLAGAITSATACAIGGYGGPPPGTPGPETTSQDGGDQ